MMRYFFLLLLLSGILWAIPETARVDSLNALGNDFIFSHPDSANALYTENARQARALGYPAGEARALMNLGLTLYMQGEYDRSVENYLHAIRLFEEQAMYPELSRAYGDLGYQMKRRDLEKGRRYMREGIAIAEKFRLEPALCALYDNYGVLQEMGGKPDSARYFYRQSLTLKEALKDSIGIPFSLNNLAGIALQEGEIEEATRLLTRSDDLRNREAGHYGRLVNMVQWGDLYQKTGDWPAAIERYGKAIEMPEASAHTFLVGYCYEQLAVIFEQQHDFQNALANQKKRAAFQDSLVNVESRKRIAELEVAFETERKDHLIARNSLKIRERNAQLMAMGVLLLLFLLSGIWLWRYQQFKKNQLEKELRLENQLRKAEVERSLSEEKLRISRELHDNIGSRLTLMVSTMDNIGYQTGDRSLSAQMRDLGQFGRDTLGDLRNTVWALKQKEGTLQDVIDKLNDIKFRLNGNGKLLSVQRELEGEVRLTSVQMLNLYRIAQEALQNALKHANAGQIVVLFRGTPQNWDMEVRDDGIGMGAERNGDGDGLRNMRHRCEAIGGRFSLEDGRPGCRVICRFGEK